MLQRAALIVFWAITAVICGCAGGTRSDTAPVELKYEAGFNDKYSSRTGLFQRKYCSMPTRYVEAPLSPVKLDEIARYASSLDFFNWPRELDWDGVLPLPSKATLSDEERLDRMCVVAPCSTQRIALRWGGLENDVEWSTCECGRLERSEQVTRLVELIEETIYAVPAVWEMPQSDCRYY